MKQIHCPTCKKPVKWNEQSEFRPFCSEKCKMIDLGAWVAEEYSVPATTYSEEELNQVQAIQNTLH